MTQRKNVDREEKQKDNLVGHRSGMQEGKIKCFLDIQERQDKDQVKQGDLEAMNRAGLSERPRLLIVVQKDRHKERWNKS